MNARFETYPQTRTLDQHRKERTTTIMHRTIILSGYVVALVAIAILPHVLYANQCNSRCHFNDCNSATAACDSRPDNVLCNYCDGTGSLPTCSYDASRICVTAGPVGSDCGNNSLGTCSNGTCQNATPGGDCLAWKCTSDYIP